MDRLVLRTAVVDFQREEVRGVGGTRIDLRPRAFAVLRCLAAHAEVLVTKDDLLAECWPGVAVSEDSIAQCVSEIRQALGDGARKVIRTVPRRGYVLMPPEAAVSEKEVVGSANYWPATVVLPFAEFERTLVNDPGEALPLVEKPSIAVLPFLNMSRDPDQEYFADGIAHDIITELSRSHSLFVIARNSSFTYRGRSVDVKQVGRELGVRYVIEGSVRRDAERVRVSAQLIDAINGHNLWAERYDRELEYIFAVQDEITSAVVTAIRPALVDAEMRRAMLRSPHSVGAWDLYQRGMWHMMKLTPADNDVARSLFEHAIRLDPMFASAYVGLSRAIDWAGTVFTTMPMDEAIPLAIAHARHAIRLDGSDADALAILAIALFQNGDADNALAFARQALAIDPSSAWAYRAMGAILVFTGRLAEGREMLSMVARLSPRDVGIAATNNHFAISYYFGRDYEQCIKVVRHQLCTFPNYPRSAKWLAASLAQLNRIEEARAALALAIDASSGSFDATVRERAPWVRPEDYEHMLDGLRKAGWQG